MLIFIILCNLTLNWSIAQIYANACVCVCECVCMFVQKFCTTTTFNLLQAFIAVVVTVLAMLF